MFERRLKIILWIIGLATGAMMARAGQIQLAQRDFWTRDASKLLTVRELIESPRGRILDRTGRVLAGDEPCMDACVMYPAISEDWEQDARWLHDQAVISATRRLGDGYIKAKRPDRQQILDGEAQRIRQQVQVMWTTLAKVSGKSDQEIDDIRRAIIDRVQIRRQYVMWQNYQKALADQGHAKPTWYSRWWPAESDQGPRLDDYAVDVAEESAAHIILPAIGTDMYNELARNAEDFPGLVLRPGRRRVYPMGPVAAHVLGRLAAVTPRQMSEDPNKSDPLRKYWPNDLAGQGGAEAMFEQVLRGTRGEQTSVSGGDQTVDSSEPIPGRDVKLSIDAALQEQIEQAFAKRREFYDHDGKVIEVRQNQPGAAVVIDLATGQALALASYPVFNPNTLAADYAKLSVDDLNQPLLDRAVGAAYEPGSTVKPIMGLGALTDGLITPTTQIQCTGYLILGGHRYSVGRCWTMSEFGVTHSETSPAEPLPDNMLTVTDAIERSCNVFFETVADRMGMVRQRYWYDRFGLGRITGIGLPEVAGRIPNPAHCAPTVLREATWFAGIGQGEVAATPLQMANAAATIARDGVWMRPRLTDAPAAANDRVDLGLSSAALEAVKEGMLRVVNRPAGSGKLRHNGPPDAVDDILVAGKTGTAQAPPMTIPVRDAHGNIVMENGRPQRKVVDPANPAVRTWYIGSGKDGTDYAHHWFMGYAPAQHPKIAFAVFVEYGGSGNPVATSIVRDVLAACIERGYLR